MSFSKEQIQKVWGKAREVKGFDKDRFRKDACGAWIAWDRYGDSGSIYGWEIDHVMPKSLLVGKQQELIDDIRNLRPMNCANNRSKGDDYPGYTAVLVAEGDKNVKCSDKFIVNSELSKVLDVLYGEDEK